MANFVLGALRVRPAIYLLATIADMAPRTFVSVFAAAQLHELTFKNVEQPTVCIAGIVISIASLVLLGVLARRGLAQATRARSSAS